MQPSMPVESRSHDFHVVVIGGGFGGLNAVRELAGAPVRVTLVDRRNYHLFQPLLYQVAMGELSPANISAPLRSILRRQRNCEVYMDEVIDFDPEQRRVIMAGGHLTYDVLVLAAGARTSYFGNSEWPKVAPGLKSIEDATEIRRRVLTAFELAERERDPERRQKLLTFVVVGAGPTGVELAGTLAEMARFTLKNDFRNIDPSNARILLVDMGRVLSPYPEDLSARAARDLERIGVTIRTGARVQNITEDHVVLEVDGQQETIPCRTVLWAAGVQASPLAKKLAERTGALTDRAGRIQVQPDLTLPNHPEIFAIGDLAVLNDEKGKPLPGIAPVAIQQGRYVARAIRARLAGRKIEPFRYRDYGMMATVGRASAIALIGGRKFKGFIAWVLWLFIHLMQIVRFQNRILVLIQWAWNYLTFNRSARLITSEGQTTDDTDGHG